MKKRDIALVVVVCLIVGLDTGVHLDKHYRDAWWQAHPQVVVKEVETSSIRIGSGGGSSAMECTVVPVPAERKPAQ
jgi:hypothetical protein